MVEAQEGQVEAQEGEVEVHTRAEADTSAHPAGACSTAAGKAHSGSIFAPRAPLDAIPAGKELAHRCSR